MYICLCNGFTDKQVRRAVGAGCCSLAGVYDALGARPRCGKCIPDVRELLAGGRTNAGVAASRGGPAAAPAAAPTE